MNSETFTKAVTELAALPEEDQAEVLSFIEALKQRLASASGAAAPSAPRYPLRGEAYTYIDPLEPAVLEGLL